jgi:hypothetical protein
MLGRTSHRRQLRLSAHRPCVPVIRLSVPELIAIANIYRMFYQNIRPKPELSGLLQGGVSLSFDRFLRSAHSYGPGSKTANNKRVTKKLAAKVSQSFC